MALSESSSCLKMGSELLAEKIPGQEWVYPCPACVCLLGSILSPFCQVPSSARFFVQLRQWFQQLPWYPELVCGDAGEWGVGAGSLWPGVAEPSRVTFPWAEALPFEDYSSMWLLALGWLRGKQGWALQWDWLSLGSQASSVDGSVVVETVSILNTLCLRSLLAV